ncbi:MAG: hypothetical protein EHM47_03515, partial [Ignavibacteriales bacterium]
MNNLNRFSKFFLFITCLAGALWTGSYVVRLSTTYGFFEDTDFILKPYYNTGNLSEIFVTLLPLFTSTFVLYIIFFVFFILFLITSKVSLKLNGWLFLITILVLITFPFEAYLMTIDWKIITLIHSEVFNPNDIIELIRERFKIFSSFPVIEIFSYFAIVFLFIYKPLIKD